MINNRIKQILKALAFLIFIAVLVLIDQWTKHLAISSLKNSEPFVVWKNIFEFSYLENQGAAFGTLQGQRIFFLIFAPIASVALFYFALRLSNRKKMIPVVVCFLFIIAGAIGNFIDRLTLHYVVDFLYFKLIDFPVFNVADIYVTCSCIVLIILILFKYKEEDFG